TGQLCTNCPDAHKTLADIEKIYGDNVIIVSMHAGQSSSDNEQFGLRTPEGNDYANAAGIKSYPSAVVNRSGGVLDDRSRWQGAVFAETRKAPRAHIAITARKEGEEMVIESQLSSLQTALAGIYQLWVTEDSIKAFQLDGKKYIVDYEHNHVYRASVNGVGGESLMLNNDGTQLIHRISISPKWNIQNLSVVGFLYDKDGVIQAEQVHL
ncbi:MAG: Omp28 family outer membrane lipoprotein, partial [Bacteroidales bacterium]|nr:Omp28 family outer membrane lipoprotein [Candidatus Physcousia equi]